MRKGLPIIMVMLVGAMLPACFSPLGSEGPQPCGLPIPDDIGGHHEDFPEMFDRLNGFLVNCGEDEVCNHAMPLVDECDGSLSILCILINEIVNIFAEYLEMDLPDELMEIGTCQAP